MITEDYIKTKVRWTYLIVASTVALLMTLCYFWTLHNYSATLNQPQIINIAGKQRMLSQRIALLENILVGPQQPGRFRTLQKELAVVANEFAENHEILVGRQPLNGHDTDLSEKLTKHYFSGSVSLDALVLRYAQRAMTISQTSLTDIVSKRTITLSEATDILERLDYAVVLFEEQLSEKLELDHKVAFTFWIGSTFVAFAAIAVMFAPLRQLVMKQFFAAKAAQIEAENQRQSATDTNRIKAGLMAQLSVELRTPISAIIGAMELMPNMRSKQTELIKRVSSASYQLLGLTNNLIDSIDDDSGQTVGDFGDFNLLKLLDDELSQLFVNCEAVDLDHEVIIESDLPNYVRGHEKAISKTLQVVLDNAVKFTHSGMVSVKIGVTIETGTMMLTIQVTDTGVGIAQSELELVFQRFYQCNQNRNLRFKGAGVGLYIAKRCLQEIGGRISLTSTRQLGTNVSMSIPVSRCSLKASSGGTNNNKGAQIAVVTDKHISRLHLANLMEEQGVNADIFISGADLLAHQNSLRDYDGIICDYRMQGINGAELANYLQAMLGSRMPAFIMLLDTPETANFISNTQLPPCQIFVKPIDHSRLIDAISLISKKYTQFVDIDHLPKVLIVEDEPISAEVMFDMVCNLGYVAHVAIDGESAITAVAEKDYGIILMDLVLPDTHGSEITKILKEKGCQSHIVAITADTQENTEKEAKAAGARYFLSKPVSYQELKNTLYLLLSSH